VPLHDNGYIVEAPAVDYPLRLVAYDSDGLVIGVVTLSGQTPPRALQRAAAAHQPIPNARWHLMVNNSAGYVFAAPATDGGTCYAIQDPQGGGSIGCQPTLSPTALLSQGFGNAHTFALTIFAGSAIAHVTIHYLNDHTQTISVPKGLALLAIPTSNQGTSFGPVRDGVAELTGLNARGQALAFVSIGTITALTPTAITIRDTPIGSAKPVTTTCSLVPPPPASSRTNGPTATATRYESSAPTAS